MLPEPKGGCSIYILTWDHLPLNSSIYGPTSSFVQIHGDESHGPMGTKSPKKHIQEDLI